VGECARRQGDLFQGERGENLVEGLSPEAIVGLESLLVVTDDEDRTPLAWLREWPEAPRQRNLVALVERLRAVRQLGVGSDREKRVHRARYAPTPTVPQGSPVGVEGGFGSQASLRGLDKVRGEWSLVTMAWNLKRMFVLAPA